MRRVTFSPLIEDEINLVLYRRTAIRIVQGKLLNGGIFNDQAEASRAESHKFG